MTWTNQMRMDARFMYEKQGMHVDEIGLKLGKNRRFSSYAFS